MQITRLADAQPRPRRIAVGTFDGVHLGHREVITGSDTVLTFEPHPVAVVHPEAAPRLLTPLETKADLVAGLGVREMVVIPFDEGFQHLSAREFVDRVLVGALRATRVSVGENFRFGYRAQGDADLLREVDAFETRVVPLVEVSGETVSSTQIRALVAAGEVDTAMAFLGAPFQLRGVVVHGDQRGRHLGYPTANIVPDDRYVCPGHGVYACLANGLPAAVSVGVRPTFVTGRGLLVEAYLIDYADDLYGKELRIEFLQRLRGEKAFPSAVALTEQMHRDVDDARAVCEAFATVRRP